MVSQVMPPACRPAAPGRLPDMDQRTFWGIARAHLLNVGIIRPGPHVTAIEINVYLSSPTGAPVTVGKITDQDKSDVPRFLNRCVLSSLRNISHAAPNSLMWSHCGGGSSATGQEAFMH